MNQHHLCFIGGGNMAGSLIGGLVANKYDVSCITACDIDEKKLELMVDKFGISTSTDSRATASSASVVILAVKPQVMRQVCEQLAGVDNGPDCLYISIAAGIREQEINRWLGSNRAVVRCMPNTPALIRLGATGMYANSRVSDEQKQLAEDILAAVGLTVWVDQESELDAVTAISGSGPAYFFYFIELLQQAGTKLGLNHNTARLLAQQTALGAATMAQNGDVVELRKQVTSKKGTTEQAILSFQHSDLASVVNKATKAANDRSKELGDEFSKQTSRSL